MNNMNQSNRPNNPHILPMSGLIGHPEVVLLMTNEDAAILESALLSSINVCKAFLCNEDNPAERKTLISMRDNYQSVLERFFPDHDRK